MKTRNVSKQVCLRNGVLLWIIAILVGLDASSALACGRTPLAWQQRVDEKQAGENKRFIGQLKHLGWNQDRNHNFIDDQLEERIRKGAFKDENSVGVIVELNTCIPPQQAREILGQYGEVSLVSNLITFAILHIPPVAVPDRVRQIVERADVAGIEWLAPVYTLDDRSNLVIGAPAAWAQRTNGAPTNGVGVRVAVIDTDLFYPHEILQGRVKNVFKLAGGGSAWVPGTSPTDCLGSASSWLSCGQPTDEWAHGTHVSSILLGTSLSSSGTRQCGRAGAANVECSGVAPGAELEFYEACPAGVCDGTTLHALLDYIGGSRSPASLALSPIRVLNMSLGMCSDVDGSDALSQSVDQLVGLGVVVVTAFGNSGQCGNGSTAVTIGQGTRLVMAPGAATDAITVSAFNDQHGAGDRGHIPRWLVGPRVESSATSAGTITKCFPKPDLAAPGQDIQAAVANVNATSYDDLSSDGATSFAAPHVAGAAAVLLNADLTIPPHSLKDRLLRYAERAPSGTNPPLQVTCPGPALPSEWASDMGFGYLKLDTAMLSPRTIDLSFAHCTGSSGSSSQPCTLNTGRPSWDNEDDITLMNPVLQVGVPNKIFAKIQNLSAELATHVWVRFGVYEFGVGAPVYNEIGRVEISSIGSSTTPQTVALDWTPTVSGHQCISVAIDFGADSNFSNNLTQRNVSVGDGIPRMVVLNPTKRPAKFYLETVARRVKGEAPWTCTLADSVIGATAGLPEIVGIKKSHLIPVEIDLKSQSQGKRAWTLLHQPEREGIVRLDIRSTPIIGRILNKPRRCDVYVRMVAVNADNKEVGPSRLLGGVTAYLTAAKKANLGTASRVKSVGS